MKITSPEIVAEIGISHNGDMDTAKKMIDRCKTVGADVVKFQMFDKEDYSGHKDILKCWLSDQKLRELKEYADKKEIEWLCTPEKSRHIKFLQELGVKRLKINNLMCLDKKFLKEAAKTGLPLIISVPPEKFKQAAAIIPGILDKYGMKYVPGHYRIMLCIAKYPPDLSDFKLDKTEGEAFRSLAHNGMIYDGYSNHYPDPMVPILMMSRGFSPVEVHVRIDNWHSCVDEKVSIDMTGLRKIVQARDMMRSMR